MLIKMLKSGDVVEVSAERLAQLDVSEYVLVTVSASSAPAFTFSSSVSAKALAQGIAKRNVPSETTISGDPVSRSGRKPK